MLKVLPIEDKEEQKTLCERCGIPYRADLLAYRATVDEELRGICQFTMNHQGGTIVDFAPVPGTNDTETLFVLGRAALNFIDLCGVHYATFDADFDNDALIRAIGFRKNAEGRYEIDLTDFFKDPCKHTNNA